MATEQNAQMHRNGGTAEHMEKVQTDSHDHVNGNNKYNLNDSMDSDTALRQIRTAGSISISPELFEKIYLSPQNQIKGDLRKTFGNPTPV